MPALTREAQRGEGPVRSRTAASLAFLAAPTAAGLVLVGPELLRFLFGGDYVAGGFSLRVLALALVPLFLNGLIASALIAAGRADWLPRLTAIRVGVAALLAFALVPAYGAVGAAAGFLASELLLLLLGTRACRAARFPVAVGRPVVRSLAASVPMAAAVSFVPGFVPAVGVGVLAYAATLFALWKIRPSLLRDLVDVRYP
jgi:O-antigen/teichoic acid export membrane protein